MGLDRDIYRLDCLFGPLALFMWFLFSFLSLQSIDATARGHQSRMRQANGPPIEPASCSKRKGESLDQASKKGNAVRLTTGLFGVCCRLHGVGGFWFPGTDTCKRSPRQLPGTRRSVIPVQHGAKEGASRTPSQLPDRVCKHPQTFFCRHTRIFTPMASMQLSRTFAPRWNNLLSLGFPAP